MSALYTHCFHSKSKSNIGIWISCVNHEHICVFSISQYHKEYLSSFVTQLIETDHIFDPIQQKVHGDAQRFNQYLPPIDLTAVKRK